VEAPHSPPLVSGGESVNDFIPAEYASIIYVTFDAIVADVLTKQAGAVRLSNMIFAMLFGWSRVAANDRWLLSFGWKGIFYTERALPFGLCTALSSSAYSLKVSLDPLSSWLETPSSLPR